MGFEKDFTGRKRRGENVDVKVFRTGLRKWDESRHVGYSSDSNEPEGIDGGWWNGKYVSSTVRLVLFLLLQYTPCV